VEIFGFVIPAPISIGINSSKACAALDAGNSGFFYRSAAFTGQVWIPVFTGMTPLMLFF